MDLKADASERKIFRINIDGKSLIGIYNDNIKENLAFIKFTETFIDLGFNVPEIVRVSDDNLFYLEKDLGDTTLFNLITGSPVAQHLSYYKQALTDLVKFQIEAKDKLDYSFCYQTNEFNVEVIESDLGKFSDYYLMTTIEKNFDNEFYRYIIEISENILKRVRNDFFLYRDFQPRNIMIKDNRLYYIDYQSGRKGPLHYDLASFLYSGSINISEEDRKILMTHYLSELNNYVNVDKEEFIRYYYFFVFLRLLQMLGSYSYLNVKRNDGNVLKKIPKALANMKTLEDKIDDKKLKKFITELTS
ncbi:MAG: phosphotransferase [Ignavibacteria bacterium]|nr:phosphotransferase [Ignavibacteria bacterium]